MQIRRTLLLAALVISAMSALTSGASANSRQISIVEDDAVFLGLTPRDPNEALAESKALGADAVRVLISWRRASPAATSRTLPAGFDVANPSSPGYDWGQYDLLIARARFNGLKVIINLAPPIPYWGSSEPAKCPHFIAGRRALGMGCYWKPSPKLFGQFAKAVATRYKGLVSMYSLYNEPNLENYLYPQVQRTKAGRVDLGGKTLRALWISAYKGVSSADRSVRNRVLFGETAAISGPTDTLYSALCLDTKGKPYKGRQKKAQGCSKPSKLPIGGLSVHPYNRSALGSVFTRSATKNSMPYGYVSRATRVLKNAERYKRIPKGRGIYTTETGFQTRPPDRKGLTLANQAKALNEADRLFYGDRRVKSVSQFELYDVPELANEDVFNTGLRTALGAEKPSLAAYRLPLVITKVKSNRVEVWGQVRPASGRTVPVVEVSKSDTGPFTRLRAARTNASGYFRFTLKRGGAAKLRYRMTWKSADGVTFTSRVATAGRAIKYREKP